MNQRHQRRVAIKIGVGGLAAWLLAGNTASACNVPVFRYALERWKPDACRVSILFDAPLTTEQQAQLKPLDAASEQVSLERIDVTQKLTADQQDLVASARQLPGFQFPHVMVRTPVNSDRILTAWHGPLEKFSAEQLLDSPARQELAKRLLKGDSVVWLIINSNNRQRNSELKQMLTAELKKLSKSIPFPEGLGLPGSELYAEVPLLMQFTVLEIDPQDPREEFLVNLFRGFEPVAVKADQPLVIPVFGRGRALEVLSADRLERELIGDLTRYLCGACSCQVKERNPGFDLLLRADWDRQLFGTGGQLPPPPKAYDPDTAPTYVPIPSGKK